MWRTGHSLVKAKMKETGAPLAGEMSGHIFFKERWYGFDDALYTAARLLEILAAQPRPAAEVFAALPDAVSTPELRVDFAEGEHHAFMEKFLAATRFPGANIATIDGLRADFPDGWGLVRASNTTPCLIIRFEADDDAALGRVQEAFRRALLAIDPALVLPF
jgi:phosphomannomutase/phosphoglucomutase